MEEKLKNLEPGLVAIAEAVKDMPWVYAVEIRRMSWPELRYEMRANMSEDPEGLLRDVEPEHGTFWTRRRDVGPCTLILINDDKEEAAYRAKWGLTPLEEVRKDET
jgi:hypothetical protein